jgi:hypothetical protein
MSRFTRFAAAAIVATALYSTAAYAAGVAGKWDLVAEAQGQQFKATMTVTENAGAYAVEIVDAPSEGGFGPLTGTITDVAVSGNELSFKRNITGDFAFTLNYKLTVDGDTLKGEAGSDFGPSTVTGTRTK